MNDDFIIKKILDTSPVVKNEYETGYHSELNYLRKKKTGSLKEHEWWKEYVQEETIHDIDLSAKYRILCHCVRHLIENFSQNEEILKSIFSTIESCLEKADEDALSEIEILFFEGILNSILDKSELYNLVMPLLGTKSRFLCDRNNEFWETSGISNGSVASAVRKEAGKGEFDPRSHIRKAKNGLMALERWLEENPTARPGDRASAENMILDIRNSLGY